MSRWVDRAARWLIGGIFVVAGALKVVAPAAFAADIANYRLVPHDWVNLVAITLPWIEVVAGGLLVAGIWRRASAGVITVLMVVFLAAIMAALARGLDVRCGCFGTLEARTVGVTALVQDVALLALAAGIYWRAKREKEES